MHRNVIAVIACTLLCFLMTDLFAQSPGLRAPSVRYLQIDTDSFRIIFPEGMEATGQRVAQLSRAMAHERPFTAGAKLRKIDMLLQNATDIPNGYVGLGPWRSEFYLTPPQSSFEIGSLPWHELLAIHEFRHVQQLSAARVGISGLAYYLFGEDAYSGFVHLAVPDWFIEGDAVVAETVLSPQGRGRLPAFTNGYREMVRDGDFWSYAKARNGSLKDFVPSHYPLGYLLVNYGRLQYGRTFWDSIMTDAASYYGLFYSFSKALKRETGLNTKQFYQEAMEYYRQEWYRSATSIQTGEYFLSDMDSDYTDYSYPVFTDAGDLFVMVERFDRIPTICRVNDGAVEPVVSPGFQTEPVFHAAGGKLCWTELRRHPRWLREDYSVIVVFDLDESSRQTLTQRSSYFMPALSPDGEEIVSLFDNDMQEYALHILSAETGEVLLELPNPDNLFFTYPQWSEDQKHIVSAARRSDGRMQLVMQSVDDGTVQPLTQASYAPIGRPSLHGEYIYFTMTSGEWDQVFRLHRSLGFLEQVTRDRRSKYQPSVVPESGEILFAAYTLKGKELRYVHPDTISFVQVRDAEADLASAHVMDAEFNITGLPLSDGFAIREYPQLSRPVRFHSWSVYGEDPVIGIELLSENTLNTIRWRSGWEYNRNSEFHGPFSELSFGLWYPEILLGYDGTRINRTVQGQEFLWWQHNVNAGLRVPYYGYAGPYAQTGFLTSRINRTSTSGDFDGFKLSYLSHTLQFSNARKQAIRHAEPRFSQSFYTRLSHAIDTTTAEQLHFESDFLFPSPVPNHILWLEFDYRKELGSNTILFSDLFDYGRGYEPMRSDRIWRLGINYQFPVAYPDFGIAGIVYFRRVRLNAFFDYMKADAQEFRSAGGELYFDTHMFNVEPVTFGLRWAQPLNDGFGGVFEAILPMQF